MARTGKRRSASFAALVVPVLPEALEHLRHDQVSHH